ncbi:pancreatic secretory granule membrane major glycoprotein GP2-like isoform X2 [Hemibagrus wyckioides]|uniref:pancreatic secretory granule membrane major glycoprotein GP2-like isoform X2 n=1 Tax=Hemibagrus wyckioides TaxID=337641 RepID=UPI00266C49C5|nr:pancreatic secretory granule membrane major glycoprotein GP2-like isoform X2 [Hemibagrus wyckioides]
MECSRLLCLATLLFMSGVAKGQSSTTLPVGVTKGQSSTPSPEPQFFKHGLNVRVEEFFSGTGLINQLQQPFNYNGTYEVLLFLDCSIILLGRNEISFSPLCTKVDPNTRGSLSYEQATSGPLIDQANKEIKRMFSNVSFSASWVLVLTWRNVLLYPNLGVASYQFVLTWNGGQLYFVVMNYANIPTIPPDVGWSAGYKTVDRNFTITLNDSSELSSSSNVNITGRWAFPLTDITTAPQDTTTTAPPVPSTTPDMATTTAPPATTTTPSTTTLDTTTTAPPVSTTTPASCQTLNCASDEVCRQINGVDGCACGYNTTSSPNIYDAIETCSGSTGSLSLSRCQLFEAGYSADVLHLNDPSCKGEVQNNRLVFKYDSNASLCGTTLENNGTHVIFKNNVGTTNMTGLISHTGGFNIAISCVYPLIQNISMPTHIEVTGSEISKELSIEGTYQILMIPYTDATFLVPYSGNVTLQVNHQMYIAVQVDQFDSTQIALVLDNCWATPVNQMDYSIRWNLIVNKCPKPSDGSVSVLQNGVSTSSRFSFSMFTFANFSPKIYLHCQVHLCLQKTGNCTLPCLP